MGKVTKKRNSKRKRMRRDFDKEVAGRFAAHLKCRRTMLDLSPSDMARRAGMRLSAILRYEDGLRTTFKPSQLSRLCEAYETDTAALFSTMRGLEGAPDVKRAR